MSGYLSGLTAFPLSSPGPRMRSPTELACTPGIFAAALTSTDLMRACACGLRTSDACSMPGSCTSKEYRARPVTFSGPSMRGTLWPTTRRFADPSQGTGSDAGAFRSLAISDPASPTWKVRAVSSPEPFGSSPAAGTAEGSSPWEGPARTGVVLAAASAASNTLGYVPQRQVLPATAWRTSSSLGLGLCRSSAWHDITMPGVQKPHCRASCATKAAWSGASWGPLERPSMVVTGRPTASMAKVMHDAAVTSPSITVQAPQAPRSQPILVPVRWS